MTEDEQPREIAAVRFRWLDVVLLGTGFATEVAAAGAGLLGNLNFLLSAHRNWQLEQDSAKDQADEGGPIFTD